MKNKVFLVTTIIVILGICIAAASLIKTVTTKFTIDDVFASTSEMEKSDFDVWLTDEYGLSWVPSYLVCKDKHIIGVIAGGQSVSDTLSQFRAIKNNPDTNEDISNFYVYSLATKQQITLDNILPDGYCLIEVHKLGCKDCEYADGESGTYELYDGKNEYSVTIDKAATGVSTKVKQYFEGVSGIKVIRYYIKSDYDKILKKFN